MSASDADFDRWRAALLAMPVSRVWRGHGSALFLELGALLPGGRRRDGSAGGPQGLFTVMIEWSWRIEDDTTVHCGSWSGEHLWPDAFAALEGRRIEDVSLFGRPAELRIALTGGRRVLSFMTAEGDPAWTIFDASAGRHRPRAIGVDGGVLREEQATPEAGSSRETQGR
ncbi:hypothetical protein [Ensifer soli]|uniref:hypothetical protein n=1 Tax=Ciceribacter sp. sgz301302 TaxID=3342379 RepID=UPI0035B9C723